MKIRRVTPSDYDSLRKLWDKFGRVYTKEKILKPINMAWRETYLDEDKEIDQIAHDFTDGKYVCFVAEVDEKAVGFVGASVIENENKLYRKKGYIEDIFVTEKMRGQKIGKELYDTIEKELVALGCDNLELHAYVSNPAIKWYRGLGFEDCNLQMVKKIVEKEVK